jgi:hypothetical protein
MILVVIHKLQLYAITCNLKVTTFAALSFQIRSSEFRGFQNCLCIKTGTGFVLLSRDKYTNYLEIQDRSEL